MNSVFHATTPQTPSRRCNPFSPRRQASEHAIAAALKRSPALARVEAFLAGARIPDAHKLATIAAYERMWRSIFVEHGLPAAELKIFACLNKK